MVRLVFRPYTQIKQTICTLVLLPGLHQHFYWLHHSSGLDHKISGPNGYALTQIGSYILLYRKFARSVNVANINFLIYIFTLQLTHVNLRFHYAFEVYLFLIYSNTCIDVRLLGPCFKTGSWGPFIRQLISTSRYNINIPISLHSTNWLQRIVDRYMYYIQVVYTLYSFIYMIQSL